MLQFFKQSKTFRFDPGVARFRTYFGRIVRGRIANFYRDRREIPVEEVEPEPGEDEMQTLFLDEWRKLVLREAERELKEQVSPETFQAYELYAVQNRPVKKVAAYLDCSENQVYQAKKRCLAKMRDILLKMNEHDPELQLELAQYGV